MFATSYSKIELNLLELFVSVRREMSGILHACNAAAAAFGTSGRPADPISAEEPGNEKTPRKLAN